MPQAHKPLWQVHFWSWMNSLFSLLALWGIKNWPRVSKWKSCKIYGTKLPSQAANGSVWMPQVQKPLCPIHFCVKPFSPFSALLGNKKWEPPVWRSEVEKFMEQNWLNRVQMVQFECPRCRNPGVPSIFVWNPFPHFLLSGVIRNGSPQYEGQKLKNLWEQNWLNRQQMVQFECPRSRNPCVTSEWG